MMCMPVIVDRLPCDRVHPGYDVFHPGGHLVEPREQIPLQLGGLPIAVACAMLEGLTHRFPDAKWISHHSFGDGPMVIELGDRYIDPDGEDWDDDDDVPVRPAAALQQPDGATPGGGAGGAAR